MKCADLQLNLPLYADDTSGDAAIAEHLDVCPLCRDSLAEIRSLRIGLGSLRRPEMSAAALVALKRKVRQTAIGGETSAWSRVSPDFAEWIQMRVMPLGVGVFATAVIGLALVTVMFSGFLASRDVSMARASGGNPVLLAANSNPFRSLSPGEISADDYAHARLDFASESPSVNPQGALIALTRSLVRGGMKDDEVVVVADVFGNGLARIAEVVEPSRDSRAVIELQKALESDPAYAAFVPANLENRPDNVRVVLKFQSVNVSTRSRRGR